MVGTWDGRREAVLPAESGVSERFEEKLPLVTAGDDGARNASSGLGRCPRTEARRTGPAAVLAGGAGVLIRGDRRTKELADAKPESITSEENVDRHIPDGSDNAADKEDKEEELHNGVLSSATALFSSGRNASVLSRRSVAYVAARVSRVSRGLAGICREGAR